MSAATYYARGQWNACCDICGKVFKSNDILLMWDGTRACRETCFELRHPQELIQMPRPEQPIPWSRNCGTPESGCAIPQGAGPRTIDSQLNDRISHD